jgi:UDP-N-acetylglucosamine acyltransferase
MIHPTAIVHPQARLGPGTSVGPYAVIDEHVVLGANCRIGPHVYLTGHTTAGDTNRFHAGSVIGDAPQDLKYAGAPTELRIGNGNIFREHVTIHRSAVTDEATVIGSGNLFMAGSHVGHNSRIGDDNLIANGVLLAGHVNLASRVFLSGNCVVHQFCRIGRLAMMQGGAAISKDLPPFCIARGDNGISGLNTVGLRRAGLTSAERLELRRAYHRLFRTRNRLSVAVEAVRQEMTGSAVAQELAEFVAESRRGVCADVGSRSADEE